MYFKDTPKNIAQLNVQLVVKFTKVAAIQNKAINYVLNNL